MKFIPIIITLANLFCGFYAIILKDMFWSPVLLLLGFFFDGFDGWVARKLNAMSELGKQLDSLCDVVSFGLAPAVLYYMIAPCQSHWWCIIGPAAIVLAGTLRLAFFNIKPPTKYFSGLPIPSNALLIIGIILSINTQNEFYTKIFSNTYLYILVPLVSSFFMLFFKIKMFSVKGMTKVLKDSPYQYILLGVTFGGFFMFGVASFAPTVLIYILLSTVYTLRYSELE